MTIKSQIKNILLKNLQYIDCDNWKYQDNDNCDECHRKYISWSLSPKIAEDIAEKIIAEIIIEETPYEYCNCYVINCGEPRCLGTKEMDICDCEGNKYKCSFYQLIWKYLKNYENIGIL
jgi:hypothetical protein